MKKRLINYDDVPLWLGEEKADEVMTLEEDLLCRHPRCFDNYRALDVLNTALCLADLLRSRRGMCEAMDLLQGVRRAPSYDDAEAYRRGEPVLRLGGVDEGDVLYDYLLTLARVITQGEALPQWADDLLRNATGKPDAWPAGNTTLRLAGAPVVIVQQGGINIQFADKVIR